MVTCGIDWPQDHHDIAIVDAEGRPVAKRRVHESVAEFAELTTMLADAGDDRTTRSRSRSRPRAAC